MCVIEYGWYVGRGDCGVCGWKDRCRDGNLKTYCHVSPILFGWFFVEASPTCFCIFVKYFFCNLFPGIFWGKWAFWGLHSLSMNFFNVLPATERKKKEEDRRFGRLATYRCGTPAMVSGNANTLVAHENTRE